MYLYFKQFAADDSGAITVDWVVLTAAAVGLGLATMTVVSGGVENLSVGTSDHLEETEISSSFEDGAVNAGLAAYDGAWLAPGAYAGDLAWVQALPDQSLLDIMSGYAQYSDPANVNLGTHNEPRYHDQYWMAYNEALERGVAIPQDNT